MEYKKLSIKEKIRDASLLKVGDVLLCHTKTSSSLVARKIESVTGSEYCHAAIYYGDSMVAESVVKNGVKSGGIGKTSITDLVNRYDHVTVLRQPDAWVSEDRRKSLQQFIDQVISSNAKYNFSGIGKFATKKQEHEASIQDKLTAFFSDGLQPESPQKHSYFCSEFVADCFIAVGFIDPSAAILYQSDTYSPGDLGKDPTFGTFWGYLSAQDNYEVPSTDYFYHQTTVDEIFGI